MRRKARTVLFLFTLVLVFAQIFPVMAQTGNQAALKVGSRGEKVSELQYLLQRAGFFPAGQKITGYYGWITYGAVTALEKKNGLPVDGQVGNDEWNILYASKSSRVVLGYYTVDYPGDRLSHNSLINYNHLIDQVAMFDYGIDARGYLGGNPSTEGIDLAKKSGVKALMVVHNFSGGTFDRQAGNSAISVKANRQNLVKEIMYLVKKKGYDGVNIDIEGISGYCRDDFNAFLEELSGRMNAESKLLTVAVPAKTVDDYNNNWSGAFDYKTIGRLADYVVIMSYDEHWGGGPAGPVASLPWVTRVMDYAVKTIPSQKILMGIGCHGYDWPQGQTGKAVKWRDIPALSRYGSVSWNNYYSVPYLTYWKNGVKHQVWFENRYSLAIKLGLVENYNLGGIAFWRMGFEDPSFWQTIEAKLDR